MQHSFVTVSDGRRIAYRLDGKATKQVLVLSNSIGTSMHMWDNIVKPLTEHFYLLRYDIRGHGASDAPDEEYTMGRLGQDVIDLLDHLGFKRVHFLGLSFGGIVGQWLGVHAAARLNHLILSNTTPYIGPPEWWNELIVSVQTQGDVTNLADMFLNNWFSPELLSSAPEVIEPFRRDLLAMSPQGFIGSFAAHRDTDMRQLLSSIKVPTLVIIGADDPVTLPSHGKLIARTIPGAELVTLPVKHLSNIEQPGKFVELVTAFLSADTAAKSQAKAAR